MKKINKPLCLLFLTTLLLGCREKGQEEERPKMPEGQAVVVAEVVDESAEALSLGEPMSVEDHIAFHHPDYNAVYSILKIIPSNLLADIEEESLVFLARKNDFNHYRWLAKKPLSIGKILCVFVADGRTQEHVIPDGSIEYSERDLEDILSYEPLYGPWLDYCYLPDIDGDGIQEAVIFSVAGLGAWMYIWKFQDGEFQEIHSEDLTINSRWEGTTPNAHE